VEVLRGSRRRRILLAAASLAVIAAAGAVWSLSRRLPVAETRRFLTAPVEVGDQPPPAPAVPARPETVEQRYAAATEAFQASRYAEAAEGFAWVVAQDPAGAAAGPAQWNLVRSRLRSGDATRALAALEDLLRHYAGYLGAEAPSLGRGLELLAENDLRGAEAAFERMVREQPESEFVPLAHALTARIHWAHGEAVETVRAFARMFASVKDGPPAYIHLAKNLERYAGGDTAVTSTFDRLASQGDEGFRDLYQYLAARSLLEQDRFDDARASLEDLRRRFPRGDFSHIVDLEHAWNLLRHQRAAEALAVFQRLEATPAPPEVAAFDAFFDLRAELPMGIARCHLALRQYPEAVAAFERGIAQNPRGMYAVENGLGLAAAYEGSGQLDRAAAVLRQVIEGHPDEPQLWALRQQLARIEERRARAR
jgi:TolA-binding protein